MRSIAYGVPKKVKYTKIRLKKSKKLLHKEMKRVIFIVTYLINLKKWQCAK